MDDANWTLALREWLATMVVCNGGRPHVAPNN
jgi:hypothetical protein